MSGAEPAMAMVPMDRGELRWRLAEIAARLWSGDPLLAQLIDLVVKNKALHQQYGLVVVTGPVMAKGVPTWPIKMAEILDDDTAHFFRVAGATLKHQTGELPDGWDALVSEVVELHQFARPFEEADQRYEEFQSKLDELEPGHLDNFGDLPEELRADAMQFFLPPRSITLERAAIKMAGEGWTDIGVMRVVLTQVSAWWTFKLTPEEGVDPSL